MPLVRQNINLKFDLFGFLAAWLRKLLSAKNADVEAIRNRMKKLKEFKEAE